MEIIGIAVVATAFLGWDIARRWLKGAERDAVESLGEELTEYKTATNAELTDLRNKVAQLGNRASPARRLTGLGRV